jgi:pyruvate kinase
VFAITENPVTYRQLGLCWNIQPRLFEKQESIDELLHKMSKHCVEILTMYYVNGLSLDKILMFRTENKSKDGLKTSKAKCLAQLKAEVKRRTDYA